MNSAYENESNETNMKYDAFISYRHVPTDIRIAKEIQKRLEHYSIPNHDPEHFTLRP